jgi:hypothetical protein
MWEFDVFLKFIISIGIKNSTVNFRTKNLKENTFLLFRIIIRRKESMQVIVAKVKTSIQ